MKLNYIITALILMVVCALAETITIEEKYGGFTNAQACRGHDGIIYILDHYKVMTYDPVTEDFLDTLNLGEYVRNIDFEDDMAIVVGITNIFLLDISHPSAITELDAEAVGMGSMGWDVAISDGMAYVAAQNKAIIMEISGTTLATRGIYTPPGSFVMVRSIEINGSIMYVGEANSGIFAVDVSTPALPVHRATASTPGNKVALEVIPDNKLIVADGAYVGMDSTSVRLFSIPSPTTFAELGAWVQLGGDAIKTNTPAPYNRVALADGEGGVKIIDIANPLAPYLVVQKPTTDVINGIFVSGDTIFAAGMDTFYVMTTDAFVSDTDTVITHDPAIVDSVWPADIIISSCEPYFEWFYSEGSLPIDPGSVIITVDGATFTAFDIEVILDVGLVGIDMEGYPYYTGDTVVAILTTLADEAGSSAVNVGLSTTIVLDYSPPEVSDCSPGPGDSLHQDSVVITGNLSDVGPSGLNESSLRVIVDGISYSASGAYLDFTPPVFTCNPMGSFSPGNEIEVCVTAEDYVELCVMNELDTCWNFYIQTSGIGEADRPGEIAFGVYPNPFNSAISITAPEGSMIEIYDVNGRMVAEMHANNSVGSRPAFTTGDAGVAPTAHEYIWSPDKSLTSGVYLVRARFDKLSDRNDGAVSKRVVFLK